MSSRPAWAISIPGESGQNSKHPVSKTTKQKLRSLNNKNKEKAVVNSNQKKSLTKYQHTLSQYWGEERY
jgi:hypothetical protein